jgi:energy-converting hydrogenase A subunit M
MKNYDKILKKCMQHFKKMSEKMFEKKSKVILKDLFWMKEIFQPGSQSKSRICLMQNYL